MAGPIDQIEGVAGIVDGLAAVGFEPILVGGMALVILGSQRVTKDYDFVLAAPGDRLQTVVDVFYERGFELASRVDDSGHVTATIDNPRVASVRIRMDGPSSVYFFHRALRLRIDLLFDFPVPAADLAANATRLRIRSHVFHIASEADLLRLKHIAAAARSAPGDAQDIAFLEARLKAASTRG